MASLEPPLGEELGENAIFLFFAKRVGGGVTACGEWGVEGNTGRVGSGGEKGACGEWGKKQGVWRVGKNGRLDKWKKKWAVRLFGVSGQNKGRVGSGGRNRACGELGKMGGLTNGKKNGP